MTFVSTRKPSIWWNIGECVASSSRRYTVPGAMNAIGGLCRVIARIWTLLVCVRRARQRARLLAGDVHPEAVLHVRRRVIRREAELREVVLLELDLRPVVHGEAELTKTSTISSRTIEIGCAWPSGDGGRAGQREIERAAR